MKSIKSFCFLLFISIFAAALSPIHAAISNRQEVYSQPLGAQKPIFKKAATWKEVRKQVKELKTAIRSSPKGELSGTQIVLLVLATGGIAIALSALFFLIAILVGYGTDSDFLVISILIAGLLSIIGLSIWMWKSAIRKAKRA